MGYVYEKDALPKEMLERYPRLRKMVDPNVVHSISPRMWTVESILGEPVPTPRKPHGQLHLLLAFLLELVISFGAFEVTRLLVAGHSDPHHIITFLLWCVLFFLTSTVLLTLAKWAFPRAAKIVSIEKELDHIRRTAERHVVRVDHGIGEDCFLRCAPEARPGFLEIARNRAGFRRHLEMGGKDEATRTAIEARIQELDIAMMNYANEHPCNRSREVPIMKSRNENEKLP